MTRGTTETLRLVTEKDWTGWDVWVTLEETSNGKETELTFKNDRVRIDSNTVYVDLTQEETLKFNKKAKVQVKGKKGNIVEATRTADIKVYPILNEEVM